MSGLLRAELLKFRTTRMMYGMGLAMVGLVALGVVGTILTAGRDGRPELATPSAVAEVLSSASQGTVIVLVLGILAMTSEFRHGTITSTLLTSPDRRQVVAAKLAASAVVGAIFAVIASVVMLAIAVPWLGAEGVEGSIVADQLGRAVLGALAATALYGVVGVGVGAVARNQVAALVIALVWIMVVESLLVGLLPDVGRWLPGGAAAALTGAEPPNGGMLPMWGGGLLLAAYGVAFAWAGARFTLQRDVT